jgi:hypothetical protein
MSLLFYGVCILGAMLGGLVLLVIFSLLAMAQKGDACIAQLELEMNQTGIRNEPEVLLPPASESAGY